MSREKSGRQPRIIKGKRRGGRLHVDQERGRCAVSRRRKGMPDLSKKKKRGKRKERATSKKKDFGGREMKRERSRCKFPLEEGGKASFFQRGDQRKKQGKPS